MPRQARHITIRHITCTKMPRHAPDRACTQATHPSGQAASCLQRRCRQRARGGACCPPSWPPWRHHPHHQPAVPWQALLLFWEPRQAWVRLCAQSPPLPLGQAWVCHCAQSPLPLGQALQFFWRLLLAFAAQPRALLARSLQTTRRKDVSSHARSSECLVPDVVPDAAFGGASHALAGLSICKSILHANCRISGTIEISGMPKSQMH